MIAINETKDFSQFFDDMQLENLINLKIETDITKVDYLLTLGNLLDATKEETEKELQGVSEVEE